MADATRATNRDRPIHCPIATSSRRAVAGAAGVDRHHGAVKRWFSSEEEFKRASQLPLFTAGLVYLLGYTQSVLLGQPVRWSLFCMYFTWALFVAYLVISLILTPQRGVWLRRNWFTVVATIMPAARALMVISSSRLLTKSGGLSAQLRIYAIFFTMAVVVVGSCAVVTVEHLDPNSNLDTLAEGLWWAFCTITTVGYGDFVPISLAGRIVAILLMFNGIAVLAIITATVSQRLLGSSDGDEADGVVNLSDVMNRLDSIAERLDAHERNQNRPLAASDPSPPLQQ
jgi:voltage-gated potassium channel